jgi:hypothetical protein
MFCAVLRSDNRIIIIPGQRGHRHPELRPVRHRRLRAGQARQREEGLKVRADPRRAGEKKTRSRRRNTEGVPACRGVPALRRVRAFSFVVGTLCVYERAENVTYCHRERQRYPLQGLFAGVFTTRTGLLRRWLGGAPPA